MQRNNERYLRLCRDIAADPETARLILECVDLGVSPDADDSTLAVAREKRKQVLIRRSLYLPDDATTEDVRRAAEERAWRNRDMG